MNKHRRNRKSRKADRSGKSAHSNDRINTSNPALWVMGVTGLLLIHIILAYSSLEKKCTTFDEIAHLTKGYAFWTIDDNRLMPDHPPLAQAWAALPLLNDSLRFPKLEQKAWYTSDIYKLGKQFFYSLRNDPDAMLRQGRMMIILLSAVTGLVVFFWSRKLFGIVGGIVSLMLWVFSPTVLAHGRLITTDLVVSLFFLLSVAAIWRLLHHVNPVTILAGCAALSGLFLSKMSAVLIIPVGLGLMVIRLFSSQPLPFQIRNMRLVTSRWNMGIIFLGVMFIFVAATWCALWATFDFRYEAMVNAQPNRDQLFVPKKIPEGKTLWEYQGRGITTTAAAIDWARKYRVLPEAYLYGFLSTMQGARGRDAFLDGDRRLTGWWRFFPLCFVYKVPLSIMGLLMAAMIAVVMRKEVLSVATNDKQQSKLIRSGSIFYHTAPLWMLMAVYWIFAVTANLNIGHRHLLPTFAPMFILAGASSLWIHSTRKWVRAVVPSLLGVLILTSIIAWPHYLSYFNVLTGGSARGYQHLVDSSLDWGQDLPGLKDWLSKHRNHENVYIAYFGTGRLSHYRIKGKPLPHYLRASGVGDYELKPGIYCISATRLQQLYMQTSTQWTQEQEMQYRKFAPEMLDFEQTSKDKNFRAGILDSKDQGFKSRFNRFQKLRFARLCSYLRQRDPDDHVGYSILIYRLNNNDLDAALNEPLG